MRGLYRELELSRKVDVVVADEIGNLGSNVVWYNSSRLLPPGFKNRSRQAH